ncbi:MAG: hypothetical protein AUJ70_00760 [Candidatus Omnitrophica bacterium CG1_02_40_15]|nr:MAG: hypothetical protein AUJ70_00760 [Candidatus Omnitrophica bacterium CG1_02_40_15]
MDKVFYEVDPFNRLIIRPVGRRSRVKKFRQIAHGKFIADSGNNLFYEVNKSQGLDIPQKIGFIGKYALDKNHNLVFTLNKWNNQCEGNRLTLKAKIIDAKSNEIAFLINSKAGESKSLSYIMKLYGSWQADKYNRLTFGIERDRGDADSLVLSGAWEINKNNEIAYKYGKEHQDIIFRGSWDISERYRISYALDKKVNSGFNFKSSLGTVVLKGKEKSLAFDIGIGVSKSEKLHRKIIFSGTWKMAKGKELIFETSDIEEGGVSLRFTKEMFDKQGIAYIESIIRDKERFIGGGVAFKW